MGALSFDEFQGWAKEIIRDFMPRSYGDAEVIVRKVEKLGGSYTGMCVMPKGANVAPTLNLELFYEEYKKGAGGVALIEKMAEVAKLRHPSLDVDALFDYEKVRGKLFVRLCGISGREEMLEKMPHLCMEDLALTCHIFTDGYDGGFGSMPVNNDMLASYGITKEQLFSDAFESSARLFPAELHGLLSLLPEAVAAAGTEDDNGALVLTNVRKACGAAALFYPGIMEMAAARLGGSYYILPSSVNELILLPDDGERDVQELEDTVRSVNRLVVGPSEFLSDHVYYYDAKAESFSLAGGPLSSVPAPHSGGGGQLYAF